MNEKDKEAGRKSYFKEDTLMHSEKKECDTVCKSQLALVEEKTQCTIVDVKKGIKDKTESPIFSTNNHIDELPVEESFITSVENKNPEEMDIPADRKESNHFWED